VAGLNGRAGRCRRPTALKTSRHASSGRPRNRLTRERRKLMVRPQSRESKQPPCQRAAKAARIAVRYNLQFVNLQPGGCFAGVELPGPAMDSQSHLKTFLRMVRGRPNWRRPLGSRRNPRPPTAVKSLHLRSYDAPSSGTGAACGTHRASRGRGSNGWRFRSVRRPRVRRDSSDR